MKKKIIMAVIFSLLILLTAIFIAGFSSENGEISGGRSDKIIEMIAKVITRDYDTLTKSQKDAIKLDLATPVRKCAHICEYALLSAFIAALIWVYTDKSKYTLTISTSLSFVFALFDELVLQRATEGRSGRFKDTLIDLVGIVIGTLAIYIFIKLYWRSQKRGEMNITRYDLTTQKEGVDIRICLVADLHDKKPDKCIKTLIATEPDIILLAGDILERLDGNRDKDNENGFKFLRAASKIAPTFYSFGNHELYGGSKEKKKFPITNRKITDENREKLSSSGVCLLDDEYTKYKEIVIGGLSSGLADYSDNIPNIDFSEKFSKLSGYKILLCHHPEYYKKHLQALDIDLVLSGHAHGGQWRIFGRGVYAPNQGLFPKYTSGIHDGRHIISRGVSNSVFPIPRIFNPTEIVYISIKSSK